MKTDKRIIASHLRKLTDSELSEFDGADMTPEGRAALSEELERRKSPEYQVARKLQVDRELRYEQEMEKLKRLNSQSWEKASFIAMTVDILVVLAGVVGLVLQRQFYLGMSFLVIGVIESLLFFAITPPSFVPISRFLIFLIVRKLYQRQKATFEDADQAEEPDMEKVGAFAGRFAHIDKEELSKISQETTFEVWTKEAIMAARKVLDERAVQEKQPGYSSGPESSASGPLSSSSSVGR
jgi:hypothetical protein